MSNVYKFFCLLVFGVVFFSLSAQAASPVLTPLTLSDQDRILVLAPHPDDEVLGAGGILKRAVDSHLPVKVVFFTYGDSNQWSFMLYRKHLVVMPGAVKKMGLIRRDEAIAASEILGVPSSSLTFLGYPDFGTLNIWYAHWNDRAPYRSLFTRVTHVPYQGSMRPGAPYKGEEIVRDLRTIIKDFKPTKIFVSHPADHNGDHLALYLYLRVALWDEHAEKTTQVYPFLIHYNYWPKPFGFHPEKAIKPPEALSKSVQWSEFKLTPHEFDAKKKALAAHKTQFRSSPKYLSSFLKTSEIFGDFPTVSLHLNQGSSVFSSQKKLSLGTELPQELNDQEKSAYVGVEWKFVRWEGNDLIISIELSKPLAEDVEASIYIFGYNEHVPFAKMPKINVRLGMLSYSIYDQSKRIEQNAIKIKRTPNNVTLTVPLKFLGNPDRILTSARTYLGNVPLDSASWVAAELN